MAGSRPARTVSRVAPWRKDFMGFNLCVEYVAISAEKEPDWAKAERELKELDDMPIPGWPDSLLEYLNWGIEEDDEGLHARVVEYLREDLARLRAAWDVGSGDTVRLEIGAKTVLLTGGMANGADPTATYRSFLRLRAAGVARAAGFDAMDGQMIEVDQLSNGSPAVTVGADGEPDRKLLGCVRRYQALERRVKEKLGLVKPRRTAPRKKRAR